jgi:hypothetical protein
MRYQVDLPQVERCIDHLENVYLVADILVPGDHSALLLRCHPTLSICFLVYCSGVRDFHCQVIVITLHLFAIWPE